MDQRTTHRAVVKAERLRDSADGQALRVEEAADLGLELVR